MIPATQQISKDLAHRDYEYYAANVQKIKAGKVIPFIFRHYQHVLWTEYWLPSLLAGKPIRDIVLKARQLGTSTLIEGLFDWLTTEYKNREALIVAHKIKPARGLFNKLKFFNKYKPPEFKIEPKTDNREELYYDDLESVIRVETAADTDLGASYTLDYLHLSEFPRYEHLTDIDEMLQAVFQAVADRAGTIVLIEGTVLEAEGKFREFWEDANKKPGEGWNGYRAIFISWLANPEYRDEIPRGTYLELSQTEDSPYGDEITEAENIKTELLRWDPSLRGQGPEPLKALEYEIQCRIAWRRRTIDQKCQKSKNRFRREYPTTVEDAFIHTGTSTFDNFTLSSWKKDLKENPFPCANFNFIEDPDIKKDEWWKKSFYNAAGGNLIVYDPPRKGKKYVIGVDPTGGFDPSGDPAGILVMGLPEMEESAIFEGVIAPHRLSPLAYALGMLFNEALIVVETNGPGASTALHLAVDMNYPNLYWRQTIDTVRPEIKRTKPGWYSSDTTKNILVDKMREAICSEDPPFIKSIKLIDQLMQFAVILPKKNFRGRGLPQYGALRGHDDLVIPLGLCIHGASQIRVLPKEEQEAPYMSVKWYMDLMKRMKQQNIFGGPDRWNPVSHG